MRLTDFRCLVICFSVGLGVRFVPELLVFSLPIGFDTVYYATVMKNGIIWPYWDAFFTSSWLLYALIVPLYRVLLVDPFLLLKIIAPLLYGLNVAGVYWFSRKALGWNARVGLLAGSLFALQLASLRISWDLLRNTLGLGMLLFALPFAKQLDSKRGFTFFVFFSLLTVFSHEYAGVTLLVIVLGLLFWQRREEHAGAESKRSVLALFPALTIFFAGLFLRIFPVSRPVETNVISAGDVINAHPRGFFFFVDYLSISSSVDHYASYWSLALNVLALFCLLYLPYLFLVWKGFFSNRMLSLWLGLLLMGSFGCLVVPFCALEYWHRWMFMLVYPFTFYAVNGVSASLGKFKGSFRSFLSFLDGKTAGMVLLTALLGIAYMLTPALMIHTGTSVPSVSGTYVYFSTSPTVPYEDVDGVVQALRWLNGNLDAASCVVLQHAFLQWGRLYLDGSRVIVHFENDVDLAVNEALERGFNRVFFVWWNQDIGWYGISVPKYFMKVSDFGRISIFEYAG